jgi:DNA repair protein SbcD/Mre11
VTAALAWDDLIECALSHGVDALLLAGDVVDHDNRYFEAYGPVGRGVARLKAAGIPVVAVAGNHDHHTLHEVAREVGAGHLVVLGRGGRWERWTLRDDAGSPRLHVDGWSFPDAHHPEDPAALYDPPPAGDGAPVVGLLHCEPEGGDPRYAPVSPASLARAPVAAWVLGHIHVPSLRQDPGRPPVLYAGSLLALDPGERGRRGAWLLELGRDRPPSFRQLPLSRVRYEGVEVAVEGVADADALRAALASALQRRLEAVVSEGPGLLEIVSCRVRLTGRTRMHARLDPVLETLKELELVGEGGVRLVVERAESDTAPDLDLAELARGSDAPALLARLLLDLGDEGGPDHAPGVTAIGPDPELLARAAGAAAAVVGRAHYAVLGGGPDEAAVRAALRRQASRLLDQLVRSKEAV